MYVCLDEVGGGKTGEEEEEEEPAPAILIRTTQGLW